MANIQRELARHFAALEKRQHEGDDFAIGLDGIATEQLCTELYGRATTDGRLGRALQSRACIAQPGDASLGQTVSIHPRCLGGNICAHAKHAATHLVCELTGQQIQVCTQTHQQ